MTAAEASTTPEVDWRDRWNEVLPSGADDVLNLGVQLEGASVTGRRLSLAVGSKDVSGSPCVPTTSFRVLCISKPIVAAASLVVAEAEGFDIDRPIADAVPEFGCRGKETVSMRHILTHTAAFNLERRDWQVLRSPTWEEAFTQACESDLIGPPGTVAKYSVHVGWQVLGELMQRLSGRPFEQIVDDVVIRPLALGSTTFSLAADAPERGLTYTRFANRWCVSAELEAPATLRNILPGSTMWSSARDLCTFFSSIVDAWYSGRDTTLDRALRRMATIERTGMLELAHPVRGEKLDLRWGLGVLADRRAIGRECSDLVFGQQGAMGHVAFADVGRGVAGAALFNGLHAGDQVSYDRRDAAVAAIYGCVAS